MNTIAANIKQKRMNKDLTQEELAKELFVTRQCISRWELGKTLPDINNIERIAEVLECTINDLIDDDAVKTITIKQAINNKKRNKFIILSVFFSIIAIIIAIIAMTIINKPTELNTKKDTFYVLTISDDTCLIQLESFDQRHYGDNIDNNLPVLSCEDTFDIISNRNEVLLFDDIKVEDKITIEYNADSLEIYNIQIIDSYVDKELYGFYVANKDDPIESLNDVRSNLHYTLYYYDYITSSGNNVDRINYDNVYTDILTYTELSFSLNINPLKASNLALYSFTSEGMEYIQDISIESSSYVTLEGKQLLSDTPQYSKPDYKEIVYNIEIHWNFPFESITVYEYDQTNTLINTAIIDDFESFTLFYAHEDAIRSYIEIYTNNTNGSQYWTETEVYELLLGEKIEVYYGLEDGFVLEYWLRYNRSQ